MHSLPLHFLRIDGLAEGLSACCWLWMVKEILVRMENSYQLTTEYSRMTVA